MRRVTSKQSKLQPRDQDRTPVGSAPVQLDPAEINLAADAARKRMAEYCQRAALQFQVMENAPSLVHQGELYLPGVF